MLGLWSLGSSPIGLSLHVAFAASLADVLGACARLRALGLAPLSFFGSETDEPSVIGWMPAAAVYVRDPDGHLLELPGDARRAGSSRARDRVLVGVVEPGGAVSRRSDRRKPAGLAWLRSLERRSAVIGAIELPDVWLERDEPYRRMAAGLVAASRHFAAASPGAFVQDEPGTSIAVFPTAPDRSIYNSALFDRGLNAAGRRAAIDAMEATYGQAGIEGYAAGMHTRTRR